MRAFRIVFLIGALGFVWVNVALAQEAELYKNANQLYADGNYADAILMYEDALSKEKHAPEAYYNLGNAYFKNGELGKAILNYERSLKLKANYAEAENNLKIASQKTVDKFEEMPTPIIRQVYLGWLNMMSVNAWAWLCMVFGLVWLVGSGLYFFSGIKRMGIILAIMGFGLLCMSYGSGQLKSQMEKKSRPGIIVKEAAYAKSGPSETAEDSFIIHEGSKVHISESYQNWIKIRLIDGKIGWVDHQAIEEI